MFDYKTGKTDLVQIQERVPYQYDIQEKILLQLGRSTLISSPSSSILIDLQTPLQLEHSSHLLHSRTRNKILIFRSTWRMLNIKNRCAQVAEEKWCVPRKVISPYYCVKSTEIDNPVIGNNYTLNQICVWVWCMCTLCDYSGRHSQHPPFVIIRDPDLVIHNPYCWNNGQSYLIRNIYLYGIILNLARTFYNILHILIQEHSSTF